MFSLLEERRWLFRKRRCVKLPSFLIGDVSLQAFSRMRSGVHAASIDQGWEGQRSQVATGKRKGLQFRGSEHSQYIYIYIYIVIKP